MPKRLAGPKKTTSGLGRMFHPFSLGTFTVRHDRRSAYFGLGPVWDVNFLGGMNTIRGTSWNMRVFNGSTLSYRLQPADGKGIVL